MPYAKQRELEAKYGKPLREIIIDAYAELGTHQAVAERLGVTIKGLWEWRRDLECKTIRRTKIECDAPARESATNGKAGTT